MLGKILICGCFGTFSQSRYNSSTKTKARLSRCQTANSMDSEAR